MTSAKTFKPSRAAFELDIVAGKRRVSLSGLKPCELQKLLIDLLYRSETRELRGFVELKDALARRGDNPISVHEKAIIRTEGFLENFPFTLKSHVIDVCRGVLSQGLVYGRFESGEQTTNHEKFREWGHSGYLAFGIETLLFVRRLPGNSDGDPLVEVTYRYDKVSFKNEYLVSEISAMPIPISGFCDHFGEKASQVARNLIWELGSIYSRTVQELQSKINSMQRKALELERLGESIRE